MLTFIYVNHATTYAISGHVQICNVTQAYLFDVDLVNYVSFAATVQHDLTFIAMFL